MGKEEHKKNEEGHKGNIILKDPGEEYQILDDAFINKMDLSAIHKKSIFKISLIIGLVCLNIAVIFFAINVAFQKDITLVIISELIFPFLSLIILLGITKKAHKDFVSIRKKTEICKWFLKFFTFKSDEDYKPDKDDDFYDEVVYKNKNLEKFEFKILEPKAIEIIKKDQLNYHVKRLKKMTFLYKIFHFIVKLIVVIFLFIVLSKGIFEIVHHHFHCHFDSHQIVLNAFNFCLIFLPSLFATVETILYFMHYKKYSNISERMIFELAQDKLETEPLFSILMNEHRDWYEDRSHLEIEGRI